MEAETIWGVLPGEVSWTVRGARRIKRGEPVPEGWAIVKKGNLYDYIKPASEIPNVSGGQKRMWLRLHQKEVVDYYDKNGREATLNRYLLKPSTLESVLMGLRVGGEDRPVTPPLARLDKIETRLEIALEDNRCLRQEIGELKEEYSRFQVAVANQLTREFLLPLIQGAIQLDDSFVVKAAPNRLSLKSFHPEKPQRHSNKENKHPQGILK